MDEIRTLAKASAAMARLNERLRHTRNQATAVAWFLRSETLAIMASAEGEKMPEQALCHLLLDEFYDLSTHKQRSAVCLHRALARAVDGPGEEDVAAWIAAVWAESEQSNRRLDAEAAQWRKDRAADEIASPVQGALTAKEPAAAAECFRRVWTSTNNFEGKGQRMALLLAPALLRESFSEPLTLAGISKPLSRNADLTREMAADQDKWPTFFYAAVAEAAAFSYAAVGTLARINSDLRALLPGERESKIWLAIDMLVRKPIRTVQDLAADLEMTGAGVSLMVKKLQNAGVIQLHGSGRKRTYICRKALGV